MIDEKNKISMQRRIFLFTVEAFSYIKPMFYLYLIRFVVAKVNQYIVLLKFDTELEKTKFFNFTSLVIFVIVFIYRDIKQVGMKTVANKFIDNVRLLIFGIDIALLVNPLAELLTLVPYWGKSVRTWLNVSTQNTEGTNAIFILLSIICLSPVVEEYIFRKIIYGNLRTRIRKQYALLIVSFLFGILHTLNVVWMIVSFIFSIILCLVYEKYGYIGCINVHIGCNSLVICNYLINHIMSFSQYTNEIVKVIYGLYLIVGIMLAIALKDVFANILSEMHLLIIKFQNVEKE